MDELFKTKEYKKSRFLYLIECAFEYFVALMVSDSILSSLLSHLGLSDALIGVISSFISLAFLFQLLSVPIIQKVSNSKTFSIIFHFSGQLIFSLLFFIPFINVSSELKKVLVFVFILLAYFGNYFVNPLIYRWGNSFVHPLKRGSYSAKKETVSLIGGAIVQLLAGIIIDHFLGIDNPKGGFLFVAFGMIIFSISDLLCLLFMSKEKSLNTKNDIEESNESLVKEEKVPFKTVLKDLFTNKSFILILVLSSLAYFSMYTTIGFVGIYKVKDLAISMTLIQVINISGTLSRAVVSVPFGKYTDKRTFAKGLKLGYSIQLISFIFLIFTGPKTWPLVIGYTILYNVSVAGTNANLMNITYSYVDKRYFAEAHAIRQAISGVVGFGASLISSKILSLIQNKGLTIFGINLHGQQVLAFLSLIFTLLVILFIKFVIEKLEVKKQ